LGNPGKDDFYGNGLIDAKAAFDFLTSENVVTPSLTPIPLTGCRNGQKRFVVEIVPDNYPSETSWTLRNMCNQKVELKGNYIGDSVCLDSSQRYKFTIYDSWNDGICDGYGGGSYTIRFGGGLIREGCDFGFSESTLFGDEKCGLSLASSIEPSTVPSVKPSTMPSVKPSMVPRILSSQPSIAPSEEPSIAPSVELSTTPSVELSTTPSVKLLTIPFTPSLIECNDSPLKVGMRTNSKNKIKFKTCGLWVSARSNRCNKNGVSETCPMTCDTCSTCKDSPLKFKVVDLETGTVKMTDCKWVEEKPKKRCERRGIASTCRMACGSCNDK
jgi:hypothetical protein